MGILEGKAVVVTGAGRGLGAAYASLAAREGARVIVNDIDESAAYEAVARIRTADGTAIANTADIASWDGARQVIDSCVEAFGVIDGLVNNAALFHMATPEEETEAAIRAIVQVNVLGTMFCGLHAIRHMVRAGRGSIVNVTSGSQAGIRAQGAYGMTKGAIASLTYAWALDLQARGVRVNAVSPVAKSRMSETAREYFIAHGASSAADQHIAPEQNAPLVCYLLSDAASGVHGQVVRMQGRRLALMTHPAILSPALERETWTIDDICAAFDQTLAHRQLPPGMTTLRAEVLTHDAPFSARPT